MGIDYIHAHKFSSDHKSELLKDSICGCFYCLSIFSPNEINSWINDLRGTALCPYCGIDSVIGESSGYSIDKNFLTLMNAYWFN